MKKKINNFHTLLAIDIGNTTTSFALFKEKRIMATKSIRTAEASTHDFFAVLKYFKTKNPTLKTCIICSVVPQALKKHQKDLRRFFPDGFFVAGHHFHIPLLNAYRNPRQVGQDRLACAYGAKVQYGCPLIVIDFGTAMTIDVVSRKGEYKGGMIIPGIGLSLKALAEHTALLPQVSVQRPSSLIGRNTRESILSGIFYGYAALIEGVVQRIKREMKATPTVVLTGGYGCIMRRFLKSSVDRFDPNLIFKGLTLAFRETQH